MGCTFLLIRHGSTAHTGHVLSGRMPGVKLNAQGQREVRGLVSWIGTQSITRIYSSPLERTMETAAPVAKTLGLKVESAPAVIETDFGLWTGEPLEKLDKLPEWKAFNEHRARARPPQGESFQDVASRCAHWLQETATQYPEERICVFTHADIVKAAVLHTLQAPLHSMVHLEISPASISLIRVGGWWRLGSVNLVPEHGT